MSRETPMALVVEDEPMVRMLAIDMLDVLGWSALEACDAGEALRLIEADGAVFDAVMVDLGLPDRPGEELVADIRELKPRLPIIIVTGGVEPEGAAGDGVAFLGKPYNLPELEAVLAATLARGQAAG
jgi:CheY-like chemotaxis protein